MIATINIFGNSDWAIKITSLLEDGEYLNMMKQYFDSKPKLPWDYSRRKR